MNRPEGQNQPDTAPMTNSSPSPPGRLGVRGNLFAYAGPGGEHGHIARPRAQVEHSHSRSQARRSKRTLSKRIKHVALALKTTLFLAPVCERVLRPLGHAPTIVASDRLPTPARTSLHNLKRRR
jgi:hypothetical protein